MRLQSAAGKDKSMRMNKKNHVDEAKKTVSKGVKPAGTRKKNDFRDNPFINLKEDPGEASRKDEQANHLSREDVKHMAELIESLMEEFFDGEPKGGPDVIAGVIDLKPNGEMAIDFMDLNDQTEKYHMDVAGKGIESGDSIREHKEKEPALPPCDGCGEEVFQEMLGDLNYLAKMILEADFLTKLMIEEKVDPEDARCITYLSVHEARNVMNKWDAYRRCEL